LLFPHEVVQKLSLKTVRSGFYLFLVISFIDEVGLVNLHKTSK